MSWQKVKTYWRGRVNQFTPLLWQSSSNFGTNSNDFFIITIICSWIMICLFRLAKKYLQNDKFVSNRSCAMPTKCLTFNNICAGRVFVIFRWETICYIFSAATASQATNGAEVREQQNEQSLKNNTEMKTGKSLYFLKSKKSKHFQSNIFTLRKAVHAMIAWNWIKIQFALSWVLRILVLWW